MANYDGLTKTLWPGTWAATVGASHPLVIDQDLRGTLQFITGNVGDQLTDISGQRLEEGMLVYVKNGYTSGGITRNSETYYQYKSLTGESRDINTGRLPNADANWSEFTAGGGGGQDNNLLFTTPVGLPNKRQLVEYKENGITYTVRAADTIGNMFNLTLASFTPTLSGAIIPASTLNWDVPATGFTVFVVNPTDFTSEYISNVASTTTTNGFSLLTDFTAGAKSAVPAGGVNWNQTFTTNSTGGYIHSNSSTIAGGTASTTITFNKTTDGIESLYTEGNVPLVIMWNTPNIGLTTNSLGGKTFLDSYTSTPYTITVTNISNPSTYLHTLTAVGGTLTITTQNTGTFTFTTPAYYYEYTTVPRNVSTTTNFTRPTAITDSPVTATLSASSSTYVTASFTFPSFWLFTLDVAIIPTQSDIISGNVFNTPTVTSFGNDTRTFTGYVNNPSGDSVAIWFGVRAAANQPQSFRAGSNPSLLSDLAEVYGFNKAPIPITVSLYPTPTPVGYVNVSYRLYGFTVQRNQTYISIS